jgi:hypothetical protein
MIKRKELIRYLMRVRIQRQFDCQIYSEDSPLSTEAPVDEILSEGLRDYLASSLFFQLEKSLEKELVDD